MKSPPIIIIKKPSHGKHGGHHGGAWKVAYADFVTAMMAFFLVMWLVNASPEVKAAVASYFRNPGAFQSTSKSGLLDGAAAGITATDTEATSDVVAARALLERTAAHLREVVNSMSAFAALKDRIEIQVTPEGLRIELLEAPDASFFEVGSSQLRPESVHLLEVIAGELAGLPNAVAIEGHTDSRRYGDGTSYGNWELSTDRGNAARRVMERGGLRPQQIEAVRGYADLRLRHLDAPLDPRNRRVSIVVRSEESAAVHR